MIESSSDSWVQVELLCICEMDKQVNACTMYTYARTLLLISLRDKYANARNSYILPHMYEYIKRRVFSGTV